MAAQRDAFLEWMNTVDARRLAFLDESVATLAMSRSHAWVQREEYIERRPMNWGITLTLMGAMRLDGWVTLGTTWNSMRREHCVVWVRDRLAPRLRAGDIVLLDNLLAHTAPAAREFIEARGATCRPCVSLRAILRPCWVRHLN